MIYIGKFPIPPFLSKSIYIPLLENNFTTVQILPLGNFPVVYTGKFPIYFTLTHNLYTFLYWESFPNVHSSSMSTTVSFFLLSWKLILE